MTVYDRPYSLVSPIFQFRQPSPNYCGNLAPMDLFYRPDSPKEKDLGRPGEFPYLRGIQPTMYRGRLWTMRQYAGFGSAAETNKRFKYLLETAKRAFPLHSICRLNSGWIPTILSPLVKWAKWVWPSTRCEIWRPCLTEFLSIMCPRR